jgi:stearoyl-CoA desaturase (delta-9 desaturase)
MSNYDKIKLAQAILILSTILTVIFAFDFTLLLLGLLVGWVFFCVGLSVCLHKLSSHRTFEPKNRIIKYVLLWFGTVVTMGSTINFSAGHRQHHKHADTPEDPYCLQGTLWHKIKLFFYWFPTYKINPMIIKDLLRDKDHVWFNDNYWKILLPYPIVLLIIDPVLFGYFYALPVTYVLLGMGYVTVIAHLKLGSRPYATNDNSWDSKTFAVLLAGEGYHNSHHANPGKNVLGPCDCAGKLIELIKKSDNQ